MVVLWLQGQTEVEQQAVVTDYSDTLFIPVNNVRHTARRRLLLVSQSS